MAVLDPSGRTLMQITRDPYPRIERVAEPYLKLGGLRIQPRTRARHDQRDGYGIRTVIASVSLVDVATLAGRGTGNVRPSASSQQESESPEDTGSFPVQSPPK